MHRNYYTDKALMPLDFYQNIVNELKHLDICGLILSGSGEPLTNDDVSSMIEYTNKSGIDIAVITNGSALHRYPVNEILVKYASWMRVSLDAGTQETRQKIHGINDFDIVFTDMYIWI